MISNYFLDDKNVPSGFTTDTFLNIIWQHGPLKGADPSMVISAVYKWLEYQAEFIKTDDRINDVISLLKLSEEKLEEIRFEDNE